MKDERKGQQLAVARFTVHSRHIKLDHTHHDNRCVVRATEHAKRLNNLLVIVS